MRFKTLLLLLCWSGLASADWTGVEVTLANYDADWQFSGAAREAQISQLSFQIEEKSTTELRVGASIGHMSVRLVAPTPAETRKFDAQYLHVYLRQPIRLSENLSLHGLLGFRYNIGRDGETVNPAEVDWSETELQIGASVRFGRFSIMPFVSYTDIDGDVSDDNGIEIFELDDPLSSGINFDYFLEESAFVRFAMQTGSRSGGFLTFARRY